MVIHPVQADMSALNAAMPFGTNARVCKYTGHLVILQLPLPLTLHMVIQEAAGSPVHQIEKQSCHYWELCQV